MMEEKKRRKGQKKADGTTATPKPVCPVCKEDLKRNYTREVIDGKQRFIKAGWRCPNTACDFITKKEMNEDLEKGKGEGLLIKDDQRIPIKYEEMINEEIKKASEDWIREDEEIQKMVSEKKSQRNK